MATFKTKASLSIFAACALSLGACSSPNSFPDGYTHHSKTYKSQTPDPSSKFTPAMRATMGPEQADQFRMAVYSLVESLTARAGLPPKAAHVVAPEKTTPLYANIDNNLRESLRHMGYRMSDTPVDSYAFAYSANVIKDADGKALADDGVTPNVRLTLFVYDSVGEAGKMLTQETGDFYIHGADKLNYEFSRFPGLSLPGESVRTGAGSQ